MDCVADAARAAALLGRDVDAPCSLSHTGRERSMSELFSFGTWVRQRRRALDLTLEELAAQIGCAAVTVRHIETDQRRPSKQLAARLADGLQLSADERPAFLQAARGERATDRLAAPAVGVAHSVAG